MILLDTNVVSELMRPTPSRAVVTWLSGRSRRQALSAVSVFEIRYALARLEDATRREALSDAFTQLVDEFAGLAILDLDQPAASAAATLRATLERAGVSRSTPDLLIAGTAIVAGATLATRNAKDLSGAGLDVVDPWRDERRV